MDTRSEQSAQTYWQLLNIPPVDTKERSFHILGKYYKTDDGYCILRTWVTAWLCRKDEHGQCVYEQISVAPAVSSWQEMATQTFLPSEVLRFPLGTEQCAEFDKIVTDNSSLAALDANP